LSGTQQQMGGNRALAQKAIEIGPFIHIERQSRLRIATSHGGQRGRGAQSQGRQREAPD
jgi:hypothetical protein